jgi:hypothetical protein
VAKMTRCLRIAPNRTLLSKAILPFPCLGWYPLRRWLMQSRSPLARWPCSSICSGSGCGGKYWWSALEQGPLPRSHGIEGQGPVGGAQCDRPLHLIHESLSCRRHHPSCFSSTRSGCRGAHVGFRREKSSVLGSPAAFGPYMRAPLLPKLSPGQRYWCVSLSFVAAPSR